MEIVWLSAILVVFMWLGFIVYDKTQNKTLNISEREERASNLTHYSEYELSKKEKLLFSTIAGVVLYLVGFLFYQNHIISFVVALAGCYYPKVRQKQIIHKRKQQLNFQFKQALYSLSSALGAGKSVENAFSEVVGDLKLLYPDPDTYIVKEFEVVNRRVENGEAIEEAIRDFSQRADVEDLTSFADVFIICKRTGGDLVEVIRRTSNIIGDKLNIEQEISVLISQKKLESRILLFIPLLFVGFLSISAPDYMAPLYQFGIGPLIMTVALLLLVGAQMLTQWIMNIKV